MTKWFVGATPHADTPALDDSGVPLAPGLRVTVEPGRMVGSITALHRDALTGRLTGFTVRHGFLGRHYTRVPTAFLARVSDQGVVALGCSRSTFDDLSRVDGGPPASANRKR